MKFPLVDAQSCCRRTGSMRFCVTPNCELSVILLRISHDNPICWSFCIYSINNTSRCIQFDSKPNWQHEVYWMHLARQMVGILYESLLEYVPLSPQGFIRLSSEFRKMEQISLPPIIRPCLQRLWRYSVTIRMVSAKQLE